MNTSLTIVKTGTHTSHIIPVIHVNRLHLPFGTWARRWRSISRPTVQPWLVTRLVCLGFLKQEEYGGIWNLRIHIFAKTKAHVMDPWMSRTFGRTSKKSKFYQLTCFKVVHKMQGKRTVAQNRWWVESCIFGGIMYPKWICGIRKLKLN